jgi:hypothetical protein
MATFDPNNNQHVVSAKGRKFITFVGLQAKLADQGKFMKNVEFEDIFQPWENPYHLYRCKVYLTVSNKEGIEATYQATGDAGINSKEDGEGFELAINNVGAMVAPHFYRMAETRALVRALRIATRSEYTALDEIGGDD